ncbi:MAG: hypothetical protein U0744_10680 [Gemmataceae bacterium]
MKTIPMTMMAAMAALALVPAMASAQPGSGPVNLKVKITWQHAADLDLHVFEPTFNRGTPNNEAGQHCFYGRRRSVNGGSLDNDSLRGPGAHEQYSIQGGPPGTYKIEVQVFAQNGVSFPVLYHIQVWENGRLTMDEDQFTQPQGAVYRWALPAGR